MQSDDRSTQINLKEHSNLPEHLLWNEETELEYLAEVLVKWFENCGGFTDASCLCISVLKCGKMKPDGITDDAFALGGYSKWKDRSIDKWEIEYRVWLSICMGKFSCFEWEVTIHSKTFIVVFCWLILPIDKIMICTQLSEKPWKFSAVDVLVCDIICSWVQLSWEQQACVIG